MSRKNIVLCICDGFGYREETEYNAFHSAQTPNFDRLFTNNPWSLLETSGVAMGLPPGQMGNSEVGHLTIGSGRVNKQSLSRINSEIEDDSLKDNLAIQNAIQLAKENKSSIHVLGLFSNGGVHSHKKHISYIIELIASYGVSIKFHYIADGRDTAPKVCKEDLQDLINDRDKSEQLQKYLKISSIMGRYYGMDRDQRWDRVEKAVSAIMADNVMKFTDILDYVEGQYQKDITDEFILPAIAEDYKGIEEGDILITANFRADRMREITEAFLPNFHDFFISPQLYLFSKIFTMTHYSDGFMQSIEVVMKPEIIENSLAEHLANTSHTQLHIAETEKYPHVTFFFNGGREDSYPGEGRTLIDSPKVSTYDLQPEMSAYEVCDNVIDALESCNYDLIVLNFANMDMVGHTGNFEAAVKAVEVIDECIGKITKVLFEVQGEMLITADHGNIELMYNEELGQAHTAHTENPVPLIYVSQNTDNIVVNPGNLSDIAPTILDLMNIPIPTEMTGEVLIIK